MAGLLQDIRFACRHLRKSPGFLAASVLMLALGICANSTVFSWINGTMLHPIPGARNTGELVSLNRGTLNFSPPPPLSYPDYRDLRDRNHSFSGILAYSHDWITVTGCATPQRIYVSNTSSNYFDVLGIKPVLGRFFVEGEEARQGGAQYIVLGYALWQTHFAGDPAIVGKTIELARYPITVIGVAPKGFAGAMTGIREDAWIPLNPGGNDALMSDRTSAWLTVTGRLRPGVSRQSANQELDTLMRQLVAAYPAAHPGNNTITLDPLWRSPFGVNGFIASSLSILLAIAGAVLLLTCANVATLALVRFVARRRDIAVRTSLGANRAQLMRQMILEGLAISAFGGVLAIIITNWTAQSFARFVPPNSNPILLNGTMDHNVILLIVLLAAMASLLCGTLPAWRSSRVAPAEILKEEGTSVAGGHHRRLLSGLVVLQVSLSLALLVSSGLLLRTLRNMKDASPGFEQDHILTASVGLSIAGVAANDQGPIQHRILDRISALPGVTSATLVDWLPLALNGRVGDAFPEGYTPQLHESNNVRMANVGAGYFAQMRIPITAGREFTRDDNETAPRVAIVSETAAQHYWPWQNPLGRRLNMGGQLWTVVGVAKNSRHQFMNEPQEPMVYRSFFQNSYETIVQVKTSGDPAAMAPALEEAIHQINGQLPVFDVRPLQETTQIASAFTVMESTFATIFAVIALILAVSGIYGVVAYRTQLRTHEIGIRVALGASRADVLRLVLYQGVQLTAVGLALGLALALGLTQFLAGLLYGITATDPATVVSVVALLGAISVLACYVPALRAMRLDPVHAIRER